MTRILGIDYGNRRVGLAVSDPLQIIATSLPTLTIESLSDAVIQLGPVISDKNVNICVVGYPIGISGNKTEQTLIVDTFISAMNEVYDIKIISWDERYTSVEAKRILMEKKVDIRHNKGLVDQMSARIILQEYLDTQIRTA